MKNVIIIIFTTALTSGFIFFILAKSQSNEQITKYPFSRKSLSEYSALVKVIDLGYNSYYIASISDSAIYLGNVTAPLHVVEVSHNLKDTVHHLIKLPMGSVTLITCEIKVEGKYFYLMDGPSAMVYKGTINDWVVSEIDSAGPYFSASIPIGKQSIIYRVLYRGKEYEMAKGEKGSELKFYPDLISKQIDGIFCTEGMLLKNSTDGLLFYVYHYRNEFICFDSTMNKLYSAHTIDPIDTARIQTTSSSDGTEIMLSAPPLLVNKKSALYGDKLYIISGILSENDTLDMLNNSIVDMYRVTDGSYLKSFYFKHPINKSPTSFSVYKHNGYAVFDKYLVKYEFNLSEK